MSKTPWKNVLYLLLVFEVLFLILVYLIDLREATFPILDMRLVYDFDTFKRGVTIDGVRLYYSLFRALDMLFPLVYVMFFITITDKNNYVKIAAIMAAIFDYSENIIQLVYLFVQEHVVFEMILLIAITWVKFAWLAITMLLVIYYYIDQSIKNKN